LATHPPVDLAAEIAEMAQKVAAEQPTAVEPEGKTLAGVELARLIDHTLLKPDASAEQIARLCAEAREYGFASVCVNPTWVAACHVHLAGSSVKVCTVIGFPLGATLSEIKAMEAERAIALGAQEVDMVINIGALKDRQYDLVYQDIIGVVTVAHAQGALVKTIIETFLLSNEEKIAACVIARVADADFVKTSTGFNGGGATVEDVALMRRVVGGDMGVKAAGGVRTAVDARRMAAAGATRIGASAGVQIVQEAAEVGEGAASTVAQQGTQY
jgi:deoxyribose-phosphate aldolase